VVYASLLVLLPLAAVSAKAFDGGGSAFWSAVTEPESRAAIELTFFSAAGVALLNCLVGTAVAWVLVRDRFPGKRIVDAVVDLPLALPTVVAGVVLLSLYGTNSPLGVDIAFSRVAIVAALAFVTLPFSVRSVQPVIAELDREAEEAAASLGAAPFTIFRRIVLPALVPALLTGAGLGFARALGEYGSVVLLSGNIPFHTEVASVRIFGLVESGTLQAAAAVSVVLLAGSLVVLVVLSLLRARVVGREPQQ
jgi:sulfate transport system permease protein